MNDAASSSWRDAGDHLLMPDSSGCWCFLANSALLGRIADSGFDWITLDQQHGEFDRRALAEAGRSLRSADHRFAVRVPGVDAVAISFALDAGASTIIVPQVNTAEDARIAVAAAHYPPIGTRSWGPLALTWGLPVTPASSARAQLAVMIESAESLANIDLIAQTPGVDLLFVGPIDLSLSLGITPEQLMSDSDFSGHLGRVVAAGRRATIPVAAFGGTLAATHGLKSFGVNCVAVTTDLGVVDAGAQLLSRRPSRD